MKKSILMVIIIAIALLTGCNQEELKEKEFKISQLEGKIEELEIENNRLEMEKLKLTNEMREMIKKQSQE